MKEPINGLPVGVGERGDPSIPVFDKARLGGSVTDVSCVRANVAVIFHGEGFRNAACEVSTARRADGIRSVLRVSSSLILAFEGGFPRIGEIGDRGVESTFDGAQRNLERVRDLVVTELLKVTEQENLAIVRGHVVDDLLHELLSFRLQQAGIDFFRWAFHEINQ